MNKKEIRQKMLEQRKHMSDDEKKLYSQRIYEMIRESRMYRNCQNLCIYQAFRNEVSCDNILKQALADNKRVFAPVTDLEAGIMEFYRITDHTKWEPGAYGILEPVLTDTSSALQEPALILMPGLVFDKNKHRIGYGGGYYDKYLARHMGHTTIALCYHFQIIEGRLPFEEHDILPDYIVTDMQMF